MGIGDRLAVVRSRIEAACSRSGRLPGEVELVAVSKTRPVADLLEAYALGQRTFGENRVQEAKEKVACSLPGDLRLRMVGHLQRNKVRDACESFHSIDSVDSVDLLLRIDRLALRPIDVLIQVRLGDEPTKTGAAPDELAGILAAGRGLKRARPAGLMLIPPVDQDPRSYFQALRRLRDDHGGTELLPHLSMGMSHDFEIAIEEGATLIRIGEAIFGPRSVPHD